MVIPDFIESSSLRSSSVSEVRQLPSMESSPKFQYTLRNLSTRLANPINLSQTSVSVMVHLIGYLGRSVYSLG